MVVVPVVQELLDEAAVLVVVHRAEAVLVEVHQVLVADLVEVQVHRVLVVVLVEGLGHRDAFVVLVGHQALDLLDLVRQVV